MDRKIAEAMVDTLYQVQRELWHTFSFDEVYATAVQTRRKTDLNGKDDDYILVLFDNELKDLVMRNRINLLGKWRMENGLQMCQAIGCVPRVVVRSIWRSLRVPHAG